MKKIVHLFFDSIFIKSASFYFNQLEAKNTYWLIGSQPENEIVHFQNYDKRWREEQLTQEKVVDELNDFDLIIFHYLDISFDAILNNKRLKTKTLWIGWGGDYYWLIHSLPKFVLYKPLTKKHLQKSLQIIPDNIEKKIKKSKNKKRFKTINKVDFFAPVLEVEYNLIIQNYPNFSPQFVDWNYRSIEKDYIQSADKELVVDNKILIGNSDTSTNNHLDVFKIIEKLKLKNHLILPLSYGFQGYPQEIEKIATEKFGHKIEILTNYLPYDEYMNVLLQCGNGFMGHLRQQGMGNIISSIWFGAKVFFYSESVSYKYLIQNGIHVFSFDELKKNPEIINESLDAKILEKNRKILLELRGQKIIEFQTQSILNLI